MRHLKEATMDRDNKELADTIIKMLAPLGFQSHPKYGDVAIRNTGMSYKECMDLTYQLLLEVSKHRIQILKTIARDARIAQQKLDAHVAQVIKANNRNFIWRWWNRRKINEYRRGRDLASNSLGELAHMRMLVLTNGPTIPDAVLQKHGI